MDTNIKSIYSSTPKTPTEFSTQAAQDVVEILRERGLKIAFAESCTGGMVSAAITGIPGSSAVLDLSIVTYSNSAKVKYTQVTEEVLREHGAVSSQTAELMAQGIRSTAGSDIGVGITGIAGPDGGSIEKPVGTVYIAVFSGEKNDVKHFEFAGDRQAVREATCRHALTMIYKILTEVDV
ncbi:MAG: CinA family protein [Oscillospiraceae bacterium]|nr:CinA family protein [Oscillospiraceae bacterium]